MTPVPTLLGLLRLASPAPPHHAGSPTNAPGAGGMRSPWVHLARTGHVNERLRDGLGVSPRTRAMLAATCLALCSGVQAQTAPHASPEGLSGRFGMLVATTPTYEGSANDRILLTPHLTLTHRSQGWGTVQCGQRGLTLNAIEAGRFSLALVARFDFGRKDGDSRA